MNQKKLTVVATLYKFINLPDCNELQTTLLSYCQSQRIKGTILLAKEGINGTIAGSRQQIDSFLTFIRSDSRFADLEYKESYTEIPPFERLKIRLKPEIVTLGLPEVDPNEKVGTYVEPKNWNDLISNPEVIVIDTRNDYEISIGTFKGAENPQTQTFRDFPEYVKQNLDSHKHKKVAMFCTGGIRCEKASSYLISQGFQEVYHLKGGILKYLEEIPPEESLWEGECFIFDQRITVSHNLETGNQELCFGCGYPVSETDKTSPKYEKSISCPHCFHTLTPQKIKRLQQKWKHYQSI
ncbi:MAG: rhodanese-related sulfurtransferase [Dolichospermum sp.]